MLIFVLDDSVYIYLLLLSMLFYPAFITNPFTMCRYRNVIKIFSTTIPLRFSAKLPRVGLYLTSILVHLQRNVKKILSVISIFFNVVINYSTTLGNSPYELYRNKMHSSWKLSRFNMTF